MKNIFWLFILLMIYSCRTVNTGPITSTNSGLGTSISTNNNKSHLSFNQYGFYISQPNSYFRIDTGAAYLGWHYSPRYNNFFVAHFMKNEGNFLKYAIDTNKFIISYIGMDKHSCYMNYSFDNGFNSKGKIVTQFLIDSSGAHSTRTITTDENIGSIANPVDTTYSKHIKSSSIVGTDITATGIIDASSQPIKLKTYKQDTEPDIPNNTTAIWVNTKILPFIMYLLVDIDGMQVKGLLTE